MADHALATASVFLALTLALAGCSGPTPTPIVPIVTYDSNSIIFDAKSAEEMSLGPIAGRSLDGYWTPDPDDVRELERHLGAYLKEAGETSPGLISKWSDYKRQYAGIMVDGKRLVFANYFCDAFDVEWQRDWVFVMDGGDCFFDVKYDAETGEFYELRIHGEA